MIFSRAILAAGLVAISASAAMAEDAPACASFAWSMVREQTAFAAPNLSALASGSALPSEAGAAQLTLKPAAEIALPVPSERPAKPDTFSGFVTTTVPAAGTYQVTLSDEAWIDVSQDGSSTLKPTSISGKAGCPGVRKSVRFALDAGPVTIEISRAAGPQIKLDLLKAE
ncbi:hypothetical protein [Methylobacterium pseudosasicola]|uniref:PA14 domain-containing protein n=1 Tax=Methylobacterium pseudosasicola TaxID=582667 RepID=A0A1I4TX39_9HYPH|nr:hypothetical protein [Methylobacterium pseudosasicola]SFM81358.1 hypothetical protein SAMN05192568_10606 [Methylobacterium pseudosasicola]